MRFYFPRREISRPGDAGGEVHVAVSVEEFHARALTGEYALSWQAHDTCYGIPRSIESHLAQGETVIINTSRTAIEPARHRYPGTVIIHIVAPRELLAERLKSRGRESKTGIDARVARSEQVKVTGSDVVTIVNDGAPEDALNAFIIAISGGATVAPKTKIKAG